MRLTRLLPVAFLFLLTAVLAPVMDVRAAEDGDDTSEETARVMRVSLLSGDVSLRRAGYEDWEQANLNMPLVEGDTLATGRDAHVEIQVDARNFVRLGADSVLSVVTLRDEGIALSLTEGTATVRLARFDRDREYFEVDAPKTTMAAEKRGLYRLDASRDGSVRLTVRDGGLARIYSETSGFTLRDGRRAELLADGSGTGDWELTGASPLDEWDRWNEDRERYLATRLRDEQRERYYDNNVWGAEELDSYGQWSYANEYGWVWRPQVTYINNYNNWAPYRYGHWTWCPPFGWTWVGDEPWGWAPYHYGRWVYFNNSWCWAPRGYYYYQHRSWWRPALVAFVFIPTSYGERIAWYPLGYHQPDPRRYWQQNGGRLTPLRGNELANLQRINPAYLRAVTTLPASNFGTSTVRAQAAPADIARRAITSEPVRGSLPVRPVNARSSSSSADANTLSRTNVARPAPTAPARLLPNRPTGAATRTPGVALDNELRRTRLYNGREPRPAVVGSGMSSGATASGSTGAVVRPPRPAMRPPVERNIERGLDRSSSAQTGARPVRPARPNTPDQRSPSPDVNERPAYVERRTAPAPRPRPSVPQSGSAYERPARPEWRDRPTYTAPRTETPSRRAEPYYSPRPRPPASRPEPNSPPRQPSPPPRTAEPPQRPEPKRDGPTRAPRS